MPLVSILILNYRNPAAAVACVQDMLKQSIADRCEILVIDNHSLDDSVGVLRNRLSGVPNVRIIETPHNHGFGYGYNYGARYASGEYLLINNPDKRLQSDGLEKMIARMQSEHSIGILAPKLMHGDGTQRLSIRTFPHLIDILARRSVLGKLFPSRLRRYLMLDADPSAEQKVDWVVGGCFLIRRSVYVELGGFDERFFLFFEDTDLCRRCRALGKTILYYPSVIGNDKKSRLSGERFVDLIFRKTGRIHVISAMKYFWKWGMSV